MAGAESLEEADLSVDEMMALDMFASDSAVEGEKVRAHIDRPLPPLTFIS